jgi:hypothetical protein
MLTLYLHITRRRRLNTEKSFKEIDWNLVKNCMTQEFSLLKEITDNYTHNCHVIGGFFGIMVKLQNQYKYFLSTSKYGINNHPQDWLIFPT